MAQLHYIEISCHKEILEHSLNASLGLRIKCKMSENMMYMYMQCCCIIIKEYLHSSRISLDGPILDQQDSYMYFYERCGVTRKRHNA